MGAWLLGLERRLGVGQRPLGDPAQAARGVGGRTLESARERIHLDRRSLALTAEGSFQPWFGFVIDRRAQFVH